MSSSRPKLSCLDSYSESAFPSPRRSSSWLSNDLDFSSRAGRRHQTEFVTSNQFHPRSSGIREYTGIWNCNTDTATSTITSNQSSADAAIIVELEDAATTASDGIPMLSLRPSLPSTLRWKQASGVDSMCSLRGHVRWKGESARSVEPWLPKL